MEAREIVSGVSRTTILSELKFRIVAEEASWLLRNNSNPKRKPNQMKTKQKTWEKRVQELENLGADRSDAQAVVDAEDIANKSMNKAIKDKLANKGISRDWMKKHLVII